MRMFEGIMQGLLEAIAFEQGAGTARVTIITSEDGEKKVSSEEEGENSENISG